MKDKTVITITNTFRKSLKESNHKPIKMWVDKGSEFYSKLMKSWLEKDDMEIYPIHNEGKSVVAEISIRTLKNKIYKYMASKSKNVYIDKFDDIVNKYNNTYQKIIKMKPVNVKPSTCNNWSKEINNEDPKFKIGDIVGISKFKNIVAKDFVANWSEEVFVIPKIKSTMP